MNTNLPITAHREEILDAIAKNPAVIITAETGAGKSTQVPQFLVDDGYDIVVTEPRRLAVRTVAARVAHEMGEELGGRIIGYRTAYERLCDPDHCRCLFATDGLQLVRELMGAGRHQVLVIDEVHEWNINIETLVAWAKFRIDEGAPFKVVVMSATLEAEKLAEFFGGAPVISVPGRTYPVEVRSRGVDEAVDVAALLAEGRNVLWFQPGKAEIERGIQTLRSVHKVEAELLPLHGELEAAEQDKCFANYSRPKCVVATNVAQTSITIDDIDAVVDSGVERRIELVDGVEGLYLRPISRADSQQRKGRAGRTKPGVYIDWCRSSERLEFPLAEILRSRLDQTVLRLAGQGFDMEELRFFHQPNLAEILEAKRALRALGCMDEVGEVTRIGHRVARLPISVGNARMIVEAERLGVVDDVISVAAILEQGGIIARRVRQEDGYAEEGFPIARRRFFPEERDSDLLAQLAVYKEVPNISRDEARQNAVFLRAYYQAAEKRKHIAESLRGRVRDFRSSGKREDILRAVCAGMVDHLWQYNRGYYIGDGQTRELGRESVLRYRPDTSEWILGLAFDLEIETRRGKRVLNLINMATAIDLSWLFDAAPQLLEVRQGINPRYDEARDSVVSTTETWFTNHKISEETVEDVARPEAPHIFAAWLAGLRSHASAALNEAVEANRARNARAEELNRRAGATLFTVVSGETLGDYYLGRLCGATRVADIRDPTALRLPPLDAELVALIEQENPMETVILGGMQAVSYYNDPPQVSLPREVAETQAWRELPDHVLLPNGGEVEVAIQTSSWSSDAIRGTGEAVKAELASRELRKEAETLSERLKMLREEHHVPYSREGWVDRLETAVRKALFDEQTPSYVPSDRDAVAGWMERVEQLIAEVEESAAGYEEREAALRAAEEQGEILRNFGGYWRATGSGQSVWWVISPDGTAREPDRVEAARHKSPHAKYWDAVMPSELALFWGKGSNASAHEFQVVKMPNNGCTPEQLATVGRLEDEIERAWEHRAGLASGKSSPSVGGGWGLGAPRVYQRGVTQETSAEDGSGVDPNNPFAKLAALRDRMGGEKK